MSDEDTSKRGEELRKKREYQKVYEAKHRDLLNMKRRERYETKIGKTVITKASLKEAVANGATNDELAEIVRRM
jgi:DNA/RNA endonuclease YhcR with UshA esterase domain